MGRPACRETTINDLRIDTNNIYRARCSTCLSISLPTNRWSSRVERTAARSLSAVMNRLNPSAPPLSRASMYAAFLPPHFRIKWDARGGRSMQTPGVPRGGGASERVPRISSGRIHSRGRSFQFRRRSHHNSDSDRIVIQTSSNKGTRERERERERERGGGGR